MKINHRNFRIAANVVAVLSLAIAAWLYAIGQVKALTLDARERSVESQCLVYGVAEGAWIDGEPYCLVHQYHSYYQNFAPGMSEEAGIEIVTAIPLSGMAEFTGQVAE
jgi:hypothetical protein